MARITTNWNTGDNVTASKLNNINADLDELYSNGSDRAKILPSASLSPLKVDIPPFTYRVGVVIGQSVGITDLTLTDNATNYIEITAGGVIGTNTVAWDNNKARIGIATTLGGVITAIQTAKPDVIGGDLFGSGLGFQEITSTTYSGPLTQIIVDSNTYDITSKDNGEILSVVKNSTLTYTVNRNRYGKLTTTTIT